MNKTWRCSAWVRDLLPDLEKVLHFFPAMNSRIKNTKVNRIGDKGQRSFSCPHWTPPTPGSMPWRWLVDSSTPLFTQVSRTCGQKSNATTTKIIIKRYPRAKCTYGPLYAWTWCSLRTISDKHRSPTINHCLGSVWGGILPNLLLLKTPKSGYGELSVRIHPFPWSWREATLSFTRVYSNPRIFGTRKPLQHDKVVRGFMHFVSKST